MCIMVLSVTVGAHVTKQVLTRNLVWMYVDESLDTVITFNLFCIPNRPGRPPQPHRRGGWRSSDLQVRCGKRPDV